MSDQRQTPPCLLNAWNTHERELYHWLLKQLGHQEQAADALHDVFLRALTQGGAFCDIENPRAWLFRVARNYLIDSYRKSITFIEFTDIPDVEFTHKSNDTVVDDLTLCLPRILTELSSDDSDIIRRCDIEGMELRLYAEEHHLTISATKSRIQRARKRLREQMLQKCQVKLDETGRVCCFVPRKKG